ncbi:hypothetical protein MBLNU230_g3766t1 [Neophaeotheca triangularis]
MEPRQGLPRSTSYAPEPQAVQSRNHRITPTYPLALHRIKAAFLQKHYRQCVQYCHAYLENNQLPLQSAQEAFVHFYTGLSHDNMARLMHNFSQAKVPTLVKAEECYLKALESLIAIHNVQNPRRERQQPGPNGNSHISNDPFADQASPEPIIDLSARLARLTNTPALDTSFFSAVSNQIPETPASPTRKQLSTPTTMGSEDDSDVESASEPNAPSHNRTQNPPVIGPSSLKTASRISLLPKPRLDRAVSHMSIRTSNELPREASRITLNKTPPKIRTQNLLKPVRLGSPPKRYHLPSLPYMKRAQSSTELPIIRSCSPTTPAKTDRLATTSEEEETTTSSPISPLSPEEAHAPITSPAKAISPLSTTPPPSSPRMAQTPTSSLSTPTPSSAARSFLDRDLSGPARAPTPSPPQTTPSPPAVQQPPSPSLLQNKPPEPLPAHIKTHTLALKIQLQTHLRALQALKSQTLKTQLARDVRNQSTSAKPPATITTTTTKTSRSTPTPLPQSKSFWSFTPPLQKENEKARRKREGRERGWVGGRFERARYGRLVERALGEL